MANVLVSETSLQDIADAIRTKNGTQNTYKPSQMASAIENISGGGITPTGAISITANGTVDVTQYASANVNVPTSGGATLGTKNITANGTYDAEDDSLDGYSSVIVNVAGSGNYASGAVTFESRTKNLSVTVPFQPSHFCICTDNANIETDNVWKTLALVLPTLGNNGYVVQRYGASNINGASRTASVFSYDSTTHTFTCSVNYVFEATTYNWIAW